MIAPRPVGSFYVRLPIRNAPEQPADRAALIPYWPAVQRPETTAVLICPGGGYWERMDDYEGRDFALWLNELGIAAFVLQYRLASNGWHYPAITNDLIDALRILRFHADAWGLGRIGVMGASAGGHLASLALTHFDDGRLDSITTGRIGCRPDFGILCYPVITFTAEEAIERGTMKNLLGDNRDPNLLNFLSSELHVTPRTPPCFVWHTRSDETVSVKNSQLFADGLRKHGVSHALHIYSTGGHGLGLGVKGWHPSHCGELHPWTYALSEWLAGEGLNQVI